MSFKFNASAQTIDNHCSEEHSEFTNKANEITVIITDG